jgi:hypothetical protein
VVVGVEKKTFFVHQALLCMSSDFFSVALKREWKESITKTVQLPDIDVPIFRIYFNWLYARPHLNITEKDDRIYPTANATTKSITEESSTAAEEPQSIGETPSIDHEWTRWSQCYELGNFLQDIDFKDALIDMAIEKMSSDEYYTLDLPKYIYTTSIPKSPHRHLVLDVAVNVWTQQSFAAEVAKHYPIDFMADLMARMYSGLRNRFIEEVGLYEYFRSVDTCKYHEHTLSDSTCYKKKRGIDS